MKKTGPMRLLPDSLLEKTAGMLRAIAHPDRIRILEVLESRRMAPVHEITAALDVPQDAVSHHLKKMKAAGLLCAERRQKEIWYAILDPDALTILGCIRKKGRRGGGRGDGACRAMCSRAGRFRMEGS